MNINVVDVEKKPCVAIPKFMVAFYSILSLKWYILCLICFAVLLDYNYKKGFTYALVLYIINMSLLFAITLKRFILSFKDTSYIDRKYGIFYNENKKVYYKSRTKRLYYKKTKH